MIVSITEEEDEAEDVQMNPRNSFEAQAASAIRSKRNGNRKHEEGKGRLIRKGIWHIYMPNRLCPNRTAT